MSENRPEDMRQAMADYVRTVHQAYATTAATHPPAVRGRMALLDGDFTVLAVGVQNLHVIATRESLPPPSGQEVEIEDELGELSWRLRFYDPVVIPALGMIDERSGPAADKVRRTLGVTTYLYHLIVQPGAQLTGHHAGHAGAGLANSHVAEARDFDSIRSHASGRERLVDEMEGAAVAGLPTAQALLAREIAPWNEELQQAVKLGADPAEVRRTLLTALRGEGP
jgi:hypothetical protein